MFPLASSLWWLVIHYFLLNFDNKINFTDEKIVSCILGLITLIISYFVDRKYKEFDFAFWGYLVGIISIWGVLISDFLEFYYLLVNYDDNDDFYGWINRSLYKDLDKDGSPVVMNIEMNHEGKMIMRL